LECGLSQNDVSDLLFREITPEDYELLCRLDDAAKPKADVTKNTEIAANALDNLPKVAEEDFLGDSCMICLAKFEAGDELPCLPCGHRFHLNCISRWLAERPGQPTCPLCCKEVLPSSSSP
jgi:hypothetical protein